jgi:hypothetical protein
MRMRGWVLVFGLCSVALTGGAQAAATEGDFLLRTTNDLVELCSAVQSDSMYTVARNFCHGFTVGVFQVLQEEDAAHRTGKLFCIPDPPPTRNEAIASFVQWAQADPKRLAQRPADGFATFLADQYKCIR